jgi:hypothetical protein
MARCNGTQIPLTTINGSASVVSNPVNYPITGIITTETGTNVQLVNVALGGTTSGSMQTGAPGTYNFSVPSGSNSTITPFKDINDCNGINVIDVLMLHLHILGAPVHQLTTPYRRIAADVNGDGSINVLDELELFLIVLYGDPCIGLFSNTSWRFVDAAYTFPDPLNPFVPAYPQSLIYNNVTSAKTGGFIGIKIGDLDLTANPTSLKQSEPEERGTGSLQFEIEDMQIRKGTEVRIPVRAKDFENMSAYQFTLGFDKNVLKYKDVEMGVLPELTKRHFGTNALEHGRLTAIWYASQATTLSEDDVLFTLVFDAQSNAGNLNRIFSILSEPVNSAAYNKDLSKLNIDLLVSKSGLESDKFVLYQNVPNPFGEETIISFFVPQSTSATLSITDVSGRIIKQMKGQFTKGYHEFKVKRDELPTNGLFFYRLETSNGIAVKRMVLLD